MNYKIGDIVPYRNTRENVKLAQITSFQTVGSGKVWFNGVDTVTKAKVWYPVHISEKLGENQPKSNILEMKKYKGKSLSGEWVYGGICYNFSKTRYWISVGNNRKLVEVIPSSIVELQ